MSPWVILLIGALTFALRGSFLLFRPQLTEPESEHTGGTLKFVPAAVLPALAASSVLGAEPAEFPPRVVAALLACFVAWATHSIAAVMTVGMIALWTLAWLGAS